MDDLTSEVQNTQQIIGNLALDALGMRPSLRAEQELKSLVKTFPLLIWEFKAHIKDAVYFFYDRFEPENGNHMNPNAFPESCRESDESANPGQESQYWRMFHGNLDKLSGLTREA